MEALLIIAAASGAIAFPVVSSLVVIEHAFDVPGILCRFGMHGWKHVVREWGTRPVGLRNIGKWKELVVIHEGYFCRRCGKWVKL